MKMTEFNQKLYYTLNGDSNVKYSVSVGKFPGGESHLNANTGSLDWGSNQALGTASFMIHARLQDGQDIVNVLMLKDALERVYANAQADLFIPYVPYARQDRVCVSGEALSIKVFSDMINSAGFRSVTVVDPHSNVVQAGINNCYIWDQYSIFGSVKHDWSDVIVVAPDMGASKKCEEFAKLARAKDVIYFNKSRELSTGKIKKIELLGDRVKGEQLFILDDIVDGGRTFLGMLPSLEGNKVELAVTHGIFSAGTKLLTDAFDKVYTTNSWNALLKSDGNLQVLRMQ